MKAKYCIIILCVFMKSVSASAQGLDASPAGVMISHGHPKGGWMFSYTYMNMMMKDNLSGTEKVNDDDIFRKDYAMSPQTMKMDMHMLMVMWGTTAKLSLMAMTNYQDIKMEMKSFSAAHIHGGMSMGETGLNHTHHSSGLGDTKVWGLYKLLNGEGSSLVFSLGVSFPTGDYHISAGEHSVFEGQRDSYMMQLGSGSYDFLPGLTWIKRKKGLTLSAQVLSILRPFNNPVGYHLGNEIILNGWASYQICPVLSASIRAEGITAGQINGNDSLMDIRSEPAANSINYGGEKANAYAGINLYVNKTFMRDSKIGVEFGVPFYQNLNGLQQSTKNMVNAGITKVF